MTKQIERDETTLSETAAAILAAMRDCGCEGESILGDDPNAVWRDIYLDNCKRPAGLTNRQWAGYLSELEKKGFYRPIDNYAFGCVRLAEPAYDRA